MKMRSQMLLLLCVPLACQVCTVSLLYSALEAVDKSAKKEIQAKEVISQLSENSTLLGVFIVELTNKNVFDRRKKNWEGKWLKTVDRCNKRLLKATHDNERARKIAERLEVHSRQLIENWMDLTRSFTPDRSYLYYSQFMSSAEFTEAMKVMSDQLRDEMEELLAIYRPLAAELQPQSLAARTRLRESIIAAVVLNVLLVLALFFFINSRFLLRLTTLMDHFRAFSRGGKVSQSLKGNDELAELDQIFTAMANERHKLDQLRQSIREMVNHDMRSPLTSMNLRLESVLELYDEELTPAVKKILVQLGSETQRLTRLANTLLDIDRMEDGKLEVELTTVSVEELVESCMQIVHGHAEHRKLVIDTNLEEALFVQCDLDRTVQVITNLLSNAIKFSPIRTKISINARSVDVEFVRIEVIDQGAGVPEDKIDSLFHRFVQLDQPETTKAQGSGLGLYICKSLVEAQGGRIGYAQQDEPGACFWIELQQYALPES